MLISILLGIPIGIIAAVRKNRWPDFVTRLCVLATISRRRGFPMLKVMEGNYIKATRTQGLPGGLRSVGVSLEILYPYWSSLELGHDSGGKSVGIIVIFDHNGGNYLISKGGKNGRKNE